MDDRYRVIDEVSLSILGTFSSEGEAVDYVAALLAVNDDDFLEELTIANGQGPVFAGDSLREAVRDRAAARERRAPSERSDANHGGFNPPTKDVAAKSYRY